MAADLEIVLDRLFNSVVAQTPMPAPDEAMAWAASLGPNGQWSEIDYTRAAAAGGQHLQRLQQMAVGAIDAADADVLRSAVVRGLEGWMRLDPEDPNWWHNQIDFPTRISRLLVVMRPHVPQSTYDTALDCASRAWPPVWHARTGQNLVYQARVALVVAALTSDEALAGEACAAFESVMVVTEAEGIQSDFSFHQHGPFLNNGGYGREYSTDVAAMVRVLHGTRLAFSPACVATFVDYLLDGSRWMVRGQALDFTAMGRSIERQHAERYGLDLLPVVEDVLAADPPRRDELEAFREQLCAAADESNDASPFVGNKHFWRSDFMAHHRPGFHVSIKMASVRTRPMEICTGEGHCHYHVSDGVTVIMRRGNEYDCIVRSWDWRRLPGLTAPARTGPFPAFDNKTIRGTTRIVGGASDGHHGACCLDYDRDGLRARKSWFCFETGLVALGAGITAHADAPMRTTLNQTRWAGAGAWSDGQQMFDLDAEDCVELPRVSWFWHDQVLYQIIEPATLTLTRDTFDDDAIFCASIEHGSRPLGGRYAYAVVPGSPRPARARCSEWVVLANQPAVQAVTDPSSEVTAATFFEPASLTLEPGLSLRSDQPLVLLLQRRRNSLYVTLADPTQEASHATLHLTVNGTEFRHCVSLPTGHLAGSSLALVIALI